MSWCERILAREANLSGCRSALAPSADKGGACVLCKHLACSEQGDMLLQWLACLGLHVKHGDQFCTHAAAVANLMAASSPRVAGRAAYMTSLKRQLARCKQHRKDGEG